MGVGLGEGDESKKAFPVESPKRYHKCCSLYLTVEIEKNGI